VTVPFPFPFQQPPPQLQQPPKNLLDYLRGTVAPEDYSLHPEDSPMMDTLRAVTDGKNTSIHRGSLPELINKLRGAAGSYHPLFNAVAVSSDDPYGQEHILAHEMGHRKQLGSLPFTVPDKRFAIPSKATSPLQQKALDKINDYSKAGPREAYAESFAAAFQALRNMANPNNEFIKDENKLRNSLGEAEGQYPGLGSILSELLKEPIYKEHPLQKFFQPAPAQNNPPAISEPVWDFEKEKQDRFNSMMGMLHPGDANKVERDAANEYMMNLVMNVNNPLEKVGGNAAVKPFLETLYSRLQKALVMGPGKAPGKQWKSFLEKSAPKGELDHTGLKDYLEANPDQVIPKYVLQKLYNEHPVRLQEHIYDANTTPYDGLVPKFDRSFTPDKSTIQERVITGEPPRVFEDEAAVNFRKHYKELNARIYELGSQMSDAILLPQGDPARRAVFDNYHEATKQLNALRASEPDWLAKIREPKKLEQYPSHFNEKNQVGWSSSIMGERNGKPALGIYEIQSDTHQKARNHGTLSKLGEPLPEEVQRLTNRLKNLADAQVAYKQLEGTPGYSAYTYHDMDYDIDDARRALESYQKGLDGVVPLPFQGDKEWPELFLKQALHRAATEGAEEIIFPSGRAVSKAVGLPKEGRKVYDKDLPNQLVEYLKKQLGTEVQPESLISSPRNPILDDLLAEHKFKQFMTGSINGSIIGPQPRFIGDARRIVTNHMLSNDRHMEASPEHIIAALERAKKENADYNNMYPYSQEIFPDEVQLEALRQDLTQFIPRLTKPGKPSGTAIPFPKEARDKVLEGQRLWSLLGLPAASQFLPPKKKDDSQRAKSKSGK